MIGDTKAGLDFDWIWRDGRAADDMDALAPLLARLGLTPAALADPSLLDDEEMRGVAALRLESAAAEPGLESDRVHEKRE